VEMNIGNLERYVDAPISILFENCDFSWRDDFPFETPWYDGAGYTINEVAKRQTGGSITVRGGSVRGSAGPGIQVYNKHASGPVVTIADVTLINTARVDHGFSLPWMHVAPLMLMDGAGGLGGVWFEGVRVVTSTNSSQPFLVYDRFPCEAQPDQPFAQSCPNVTGDIGGDIQVQWQGNAAQCIPVLLSGDKLGAKPLENDSAYGLELLKNVSIGCTKH
jgi:hypothetical protein